MVYDGRGPAFHATHGWVDSEASVRVGRAHWGVPKRLGRFDDGRSLHEAEREIVSVAVRPAAGPGLPGPLRGRFVQLVGDLLVAAPLAGSARAWPVRARWSAPPGSPLAVLAGRPPLISVALSNLTLWVGRSDAAAAPHQSAAASSSMRRS